MVGFPLTLLIRITIPEQQLKPPRQFALGEAFHTQPKSSPVVSQDSKRGAHLVVNRK